ncbi:MAG: hypothetical protein CVU00_00150 [Bacteroidetes bacterium HGW-Bacteroidetes-17]|jgi:small GTP-binding protein|nr:MAG: hypothetical protein CVU00_00150 [Bacteroidetes bacterium HGW-Bacteroidetes-17]
MNLEAKNILKIVKDNKVIKDIYLSGIQLNYFPIDLLEFSWLKSIDLVDNDITEIPKDIKILENLESIKLSYNSIKKIPKELVFLPNLKRLEISGNPLIEPPIEIVNQGLDAIKNYFIQLESDESKVFEAKLLIVGEGYVGKSTLMHRILYNNFNKEITSTEGIEIKTLKLDINDINDFKINIWDFGGQEIYHSTHQFFLTKRSLYIFVWDSIKEDKYISIDYWLNIIKLLSDSSPVIIVQNKVDKRVKNLDEKSLMKYFPNIVGFYNVSAKNNIGIESLIECIKSEVFKLEHIGDSLPKAWIDIRIHLQSLEKNYLNFNEYISICSDYALDESSALFLSRYYHDLGVFLHFQGNPILKEIIFLKPEWATNAVYSLTDTKEVIENFGQFNYNDLLTFWKSYPRENHIYLLELMKKFELCFEISDSKEYIIPELLPESIEKIPWDYQNNLKFEYHYSFMPKAILTRFIVLNHHLIKNKIFWRNGVLIMYEGSQALLINDYLNKKINVFIYGENKSDVLSIIRKDMNYIHKSLNNPEVNEMIHCICEECKESNNPHLFNYSTLRKFQSKNKKTIECLKSISDIEISKLLGYFEPIEDEKELIKEIHKIVSEISKQYNDPEIAKKQINKYILLQPNFFGLGININKLIEDYFKKMKKN